MIVLGTSRANLIPPDLLGSKAFTPVTSDLLGNIKVRTIPRIAPRLGLTADRK